MYTSTYRELYYERPCFPVHEACSILSKRILQHNEQNTFRRRVQNEAHVRISRLEGRFVKKCKPQGLNLSLQRRVEVLMERKISIVRDAEKPFRPIRDMFVRDILVTHKFLALSFSRIPRSFSNLTLEHRYSNRCSYSSCRFIMRQILRHTPCHQTHSNVLIYPIRSRT